MHRQICLAALSLAVAIGGVTAAVAAEHKHHAGPITDPRAAYKPQGSNHETWCDINSQCNGWDQWLEDVKEGKLKAGG
jgi:hypothetical protein